MVMYGTNAQGYDTVTKYLYSCIRFYYSYDSTNAQGYDTVTKYLHGFSMVAYGTNTYGHQVAFLDVSGISSDTITLKPIRHAHSRIFTVYFIDIDVQIFHSLVIQFSLVRID